MKSLLIGSVAALVVLLVTNMFVFPLVFGSGAPLPYTGLRDQPLFQYHALALLLTAILLAAICQRGAPTVKDATTIAVLAGLIASLPSALHTYAMVDIAIGTQIAPIAWTVFTWGFAGSTVGLFLQKQAMQAG